MRILVLGDFHCRTIWKDIVAKEAGSCDKIVFLGDYTCPKEVKLDDPTDACGFLYEVLDYKDQNPDKVILLRGNKDLASLGYYWAKCYPQDHPKVQEYWQTKDVKNWFLKNTQWVYIIPETNIVCSHAGIGRYFLKECSKRTKSENGSILKQISELNRLVPSELFGFTANNPFDTNGISPTQPCTWIRPRTLIDFGVNDIIHVVGHTPVNHIVNLKYKIAESEGTEITEIYPDIWCCDCLQNKEYLIIENNKFIVKKLWEK